MQRPPVRAYLGGFFVLGLCTSFAGPALTHLRDRVGTTDGGIASIFVGQSLGYVAGSLVAGRLLDGGRGHSAWAVAATVNVVGIVGVAVSPTLGWMVAVFAMMGAAGGVSDVSGNTLAVWTRPRAAAPLLNRLHLCFALGALAAPLVVARALRWFDSVGPVAVVAGAVAACSVVAFVRTPSPRRQIVDFSSASFLPRARRVQLAAVCTFFFLYVAVETGVASWIHTYVEEVDPGRPGLATAVNVSFWVGFVAGRTLAIATAARIGPGPTVAGCTVVSLIAAASFATFAYDGAAVIVVVVVFATALAPQYASMVSYAEHHLSLSGASTAAFVAASGVGALLLPWGIGQLFDRFGAGSLRPTILLSTAACAAAALAVRTAVSRGAGAARPAQLAIHDR